MPSGHDPGIDAQQQPVGGSLPWWGTARRTRPDPAAGGDPGPAPAQVQAADLHRRRPGPGEPAATAGCRRLHPAGPRVVRAGRRGRAAPPVAARTPHRRPAGRHPVQPLPLLLGSTAASGAVTGIAAKCRPATSARTSGRRTPVAASAAAQHPPGRRLLHARRPASSTRPAAPGSARPRRRATPRAQEPGHVPQPGQITVDGARRVHRPVRMDQPGQPGQQVADQRQRVTADYQRGGCAGGRH